MYAKPRKISIQSRRPAGCLTICKIARLVHRAGPLVSRLPPHCFTISQWRTRVCVHSISNAINTGTTFRRVEGIEGFGEPGPQCQLPVMWASCRQQWRKTVYRICLESIYLALLCQLRYGYGHSLVLFILPHNLTLPCLSFCSAGGRECGIRKVHEQT